MHQSMGLDGQGAYGQYAERIRLAKELIATYKKRAIGMNTHAHTHKIISSWS